MRQNTPLRSTETTHEGGRAVSHLPLTKQLERAVCSCMLWEDEFYEDGQKIAARIYDLASRVETPYLMNLARDVRYSLHLRHAPLLLLSALAEQKSGHWNVADCIADVINRPDEMAELLAIYWRNGKHPLTARLKKGLAKAFTKFDAYQLAKYNRPDAIKLRDVMFLVHPKPKDEEQARTFKALADNKLAPPDTWESAGAAGKDKCETFTRLLIEHKLGYLALLRNLRSMDQAGVDNELIRGAILDRQGTRYILPFRYVAAARAVPKFEPELDVALTASLEQMRALPGDTIILVDVSFSMNYELSGRSQLTRMDAAATLAAILPGRHRVFTFSDSVIEVPHRTGMAGVDAILNSQSHQGTYLGEAVSRVNKEPHDRLIVITDEQTRDNVPDPVAKRAYMINVASNENGVGYRRWVHIDGFSESVLRFIEEYERGFID